MAISRLAALLPVVSMILSVSAFSQNYPARPVRIICSGIGTSGDIASRIIAQGISGPLGQPVVVDNRATAVVAGDAVVKAQPDGYTVLLTGTNFWATPLLEKTSYDPVKDVTPVTLTTKVPYVLLVHPSLSVKTFQEFIALAKAKPGEINYASAGFGSPSHLGTELLKSMAGINIVRIDYKTTASATADLLAGHVQLTLTPPGSLMPLAKAGKLVALAVTSAEPSALFPELPTVAASGLPGYETVQYQGIMAPARTSGEIVNRLNHEIVRVLTQPSVKDKFFELGSEVVASSPEQFAAVLKADMDRLSALIKVLGIKKE